MLKEIKIFESLMEDQSKLNTHSGSFKSSSPLSGMSTQLYPLADLVQDVLMQEGELWKRNESILQLLRSNSTARPNGMSQDSTDGASSRTIHLPAGDDDPDTNSEGLDLIRYGRLTKNIHKYFTKLEKRHACLHLTARKAKHDTLRHVERNVHVSNRAGPPEFHSFSASIAADHTDGQVELKEEDRLVYRFVLMCSQFPMLSAPEPPTGQSPSPPIPPLPMKFNTGVLGSLTEDDLSHTAPAYSHIVLDSSSDSSKTVDTRPNGIHDHEDTPAVTQPGTRWTVKNNNGVEVDVARGNGHKEVSEYPDTKRNVSQTDRVDGIDHLDGRSNPSEPIHIKAYKSRGKTRSSKRNIQGSTKSTVGFPSSQAKLPAADSDEEDEIITIMSSKSTMSHSGGMGNREHPFSPMVNREMLCNLVRRAFNQTDDQQLLFEQALRQEYGRRSKGEILAKELAGQLQVLENNAHPFYKPKLFVTRNGYDIWLQAEKHRVRSLIDKFWHFSLPRPQLWRHYNPTDYHHAYSTLLQKIISAESRTEHREPVHSGRTPSSPLSPTASRLLTEFGLRYGVGELYRRIVYLDYLAKHFDYEIWYIKHCTEELRAIRNLLPRNRSKVTAVRREMEILRAAVHLLHGQADNSLTRIDRLFIDTDPVEGVASLIELLAEVLDAEQSLFGKKVPPVEQWLKKYLKKGFSIRYERRKVIAADETTRSRSTQQQNMLLPTLVNSLLLDTREEVFEYRDKFQNVFRPYFDIVPLAKVEFYHLLCADACSLCTGLLHRSETHQKVSLEMLGLMYRLNERDIEWEAVIPPGLQVWRRTFSDLALVWMEVLAKQINKWVIDSIANDEWTPLTFSAPQSPSERNSSPQTVGVSFHSSPRITRSNRISPFPSPRPSGKNSVFMSSFLGKSRSAGAFSPYSVSSVMLRRTEERSFPIPSEEGSGAVTDASSNTNSESSSAASSNVFIGGGIPTIMGQGLTEKLNGDSLLNFCQDVSQRQSSSQDDDDSVVLGGQEIPVSVSVYSSGFDSEKGFLSSEPVISDSHTSLKETINREQSTETESTELAHSDLTVNSIPKYSTTPSESNVNSAFTPYEATPTPEEKGGVSVPESDEKLHPVDVNVTVLSTEEFLNDCVSPQLTVVRDQRQKFSYDSKMKSQIDTLQESTSDPCPSISIEAIDPTLPVGSGGEAPLVKFGNLLDSCKAGESDDPKIIKPMVVKPSVDTSSHVFQQWSMHDSTATGEFHIPPASVGTVPELANWWKTHTPKDSIGIGSTESSAGSTTTSSEQGIIVDGGRDSVDLPSDDNECITPVQDNPTANETFQNFLFPVSNSPVDIITMLTRLACFTGTILNVLTPKLQRNTFPTSDKPSHEYAPEVLQAREQTKLLWTNAENNRTEFLKKLHRIMLNAIKLYADNILCMDLCCFSGVDAIELVGDQKLQHLQRRKTAKELWGCRHMVEAKQGLHPHGMPCQRKTNSRTFESITRDMCIRINNIYTLIKTFSSLEAHLYSCMRRAIYHPVSALGYISSDPGELSPLRTQQIPKLNPQRKQPSLPRSMDGFLHVSSNQKGTWPNPTSPCFGPMESDSSRGILGGHGVRDREEELPDVGFKSKESQRMVEYLQTTHKSQLRLLCLRMNKFFKPALSLLLELKLGDYPVEKRLLPLLTFLERHRISLQKYLYPDCFHSTMEFMWEYILQDLEAEAIALRVQKRPVTDRAQMLLQTVSLMIEFMYNKRKGIPLDTLTDSSMYLLGLLDIMTRSTGQLVNMFNKLCAPQFPRSQLDLSKASVFIDLWVIHYLRNQLHRYKKCFIGKEFVDKVVEIGQNYDSKSGNHSASEALAAESDGHVSSRTGFSPVEQPTIQYTARYAKEVAQFLLNEGVLIQLPHTNSLSRSAAITPMPTTDEDVSFLTSYDSTQVVGTSERLHSNMSSSGISPQDSVSSPNATPKQVRGAKSANTARHAFFSSYNSHEGTTDVRGLGSNFSFSVQVYYKFADSEDSEHSSLYQSQILAASTISGVKKLSSSQKSNLMAASLKDEHRDFTNAKLGTLFLVYDLLLQRARKEKIAKHCLQLPRALEVVEQRRSRNVNCDLILKL